MERLDQWLNLWEGLYRFWEVQEILAASVQKQKLASILATHASTPLQNWRFFRNYCLSYRGKDFDWERFVEYEELEKEGKAGLAFLPPLIASWTAQSRRVFHLETELQMMFELTSLSELCWSDIPWPFDSFVVTLGRPLNNAVGTDYDCLVFSRIPMPTGIVADPCTGGQATLAVLPKTLEQCTFFSEKKEQRLLRLAKKRRWMECLTELQRFSNQPLGHEKLSLPSQHITWEPGRRIRDTMDDFDTSVLTQKVQASFDDAALAWRIVVGLCMYLSTLRSNSNAVTPTEVIQTRAMGAVRSISDGAHLCSVSSQYTLTRAERTHLVDSEGRPALYRHLSPHWRRGFFRRPIGEGGNPDAPRTVWVRPTLVRADLLEEGHQPAGSIQKLRES